MSFWTDLIKDIQLGVESAAGGESNVTGQAGAQNATAPQQLAAEAPGLGILSFAEGVWTSLTDWRLWASLGWLVLGIGLMFAGVFLWMKHEGIAPPVPIPVPV